MHYLLRSVRIAQEASVHHGERVDVRIEGGRIAEVGERLAPGDAMEIRGADLWARLS